MNFWEREPITERNYQHLNLIAEIFDIHNILVMNVYLFGMGQIYES